MATVQLAPIHTRLLKAWTVLGSGGTALSTSSTSQVQLASVTVPAGYMGANGKLRITTQWSFTGAGGNRLPVVKFGGTTIYNPSIGSSNFSAMSQQFVFNRNNVAVQIMGLAVVQSFGASNAAALTPGAINTAAAADVTFHGNLAVGTDSLTLEAYLVELFYGA